MGVGISAVFILSQEVFVSGKSLQYVNSVVVCLFENWWNGVSVGSWFVKVRKEEMGEYNEVDDKW